MNRESGVHPPARVAGPSLVAAVHRFPVVQRLPVVQRAPVTNDAEFGTAVGGGQWAPAVAYLAGLAQPALEKLAGTVALAGCEGLLTAVGPTQHLVRGTLLIRGFTLTKGSDWTKAAQFVSGLDNTGLAGQVATLTPPDKKQLAKGARNSPSGGDDRLLDEIMRALRVGEGELFGKITVVLTPQNGVAHRWSADEGYKCKAEITFDPDPDVVDASVIAFVQTMRLVDASNDSIDDRKGISDRLNKKNQAVDRGPSSKSGWYAQTNEGPFVPKSNYTGVTTGYVINGKPQAASMVDTPDGKFRSSSWTYETTVVAKEGKDAGLTYAVVTWGFTVDDQLKLTEVPRKVFLKPTSDFASAVGAWNRQAAKDPATKGQAQLPAQRSVADPAGPVQRSVTDHAGRQSIAPAGLIALQRSAGNAAVAAMIGSLPVVPQWEPAHDRQMEESPGREKLGT